jgi:hypothetical protein
VKTIVPVDWKRPRNVAELRRDAAFGEQVYQIWAVLRDEVLSARRRELPDARRRATAGERA